MDNLGFYWEKKHFSPRSLFRVPKEGDRGIDLIWVALLKMEQALLSSSSSRLKLAITRAVCGCQ